MRFLRCRRFVLVDQQRREKLRTWTPGMGSHSVAGTMWNGLALLVLIIDSSYQQVAIGLVPISGRVP